MEKLVKSIKNFYPAKESDESILKLIWQVYAFTRTIIPLPSPDKLTIRISNRMKRKSGQFKYKLYKNNTYTMTILLSRKLLINIPESAEKLICTVLHEACHVSTLFSYLIGAQPLCTNHGYYFQKEMCIINLIFKGLRPVRIYHDYKIDHKFRVVCVDCRAEVRRVIHRGRLTSQSRHKQCGGRLIYQKILPPAQKLDSQTNTADAMFSCS